MTTELPLHELLKDPGVQALMQRDGTSHADIASLMRGVAQARSDASQTYPGIATGRTAAQLS